MGGTVAFIDAEHALDPAWAKILGVKLDDLLISQPDNGEQALDILKRHDIDLIFLDLKLFGMNGIELCRRIRKDKPISIIFAITGWAGLFEVEECREAGFDDFFIKPVQLEIIFKAVENAFEKLERWARRYPV